MILLEADGSTVSVFRIYYRNPRVNEGREGEETCKNVMQLG